MLLRFSILSALLLGDASAVILAAAFALSVVAVATSWRCSSAVDERARSTRLLVNAGLAMLFVLLVPRVLVLADWGMTLHKLATFCAWAAVAGIVAGGFREADGESLRWRAESPRSAARFWRAR